MSNWALGIVVTTSGLGKEDKNRVQRTVKDAGGGMPARAVGVQNQQLNQFVCSQTTRLTSRSAVRTC